MICPCFLIDWHREGGRLEHPVATYPGRSRFMRRLKAVFALIVLVAVMWGLNTRLGTVPPLGKFLDPLGGFWQNNTTSDEIPEKLEIPGLMGQVTVVWDDRHVPHVFAANETALYRAP